MKVASEVTGMSWKYIMTEGRFPPAAVMGHMAAAAAASDITKHQKLI